MKSRLETIRLRKTEKKVADIIALPIVLVLAILFYIGKLIVKTLYRFKRSLYKLSLTIGVVFFLTNIFGVTAHAPRANASVPFVGKPQTEHEQIIAYIESVFGEDAPKAFLLLHGTDKCHGENGSLNPTAQNYNDDPQHSIDYGIFQINNYWQGVSNTAFLFDWKINIDMAHNIYVRDHHSFKLWTGGKCQGI